MNFSHRFQPQAVLDRLCVGKLYSSDMEIDSGFRRSVGNSTPRVRGAVAIFGSRRPCATVAGQEMLPP